MSNHFPIHEVLQKYWGYSEFRPLQEDIINSVLEGRDTLALLPTGGGKSLCFQVPAMALEGVCIVISPLIALMKDQVYNLAARKIPATAIFSGMRREEIESQLNRCQFGGIKFLYVSPERLKTDLFLERLKTLPISMIAVDEAHCISQWGYDFRPPYMEIAEIRKIRPEIPILAVTATATDDVVIDIQERLNFSKKNVIKASFERTNLSYNFVYEDNKINKTIDIFKAIPGTGLVYLRNRAKTKEIAHHLASLGLNADFYHAGLNAEERAQKQLNWTTDKTRIIACTNAFGMGIDKPNVRCVVHLELPEDLESYFQEAGRAGRDGLQAFSVVLYNQNDIIKLKEKKEQFPTNQEIKTIYSRLFSFYNIAYESGLDLTFNFELKDFCTKYKLELISTYKSIELIAQNGIITMSEAYYRPSKLYIKANKNDLYEFQVYNQNVDPLIKLILRTYTGVLDTYVKIDEKKLAAKLNTTSEKIKAAIIFTQKHDIWDYIPSSDSPMITFNENRINENNLLLDYAFISQRRKTYCEKINSMLAIVSSNKVCRNKLMLEYFSEKYEKKCGICDVCRTEKSKTKEYFEPIKTQILTLLANGSKCPIDTMIKQIASYNKKEVTEVIDYLILYELLVREQGNIIYIKDV
jgi:ATP-dependent DNA helicase RecQ